MPIGLFMNYVIFRKDSLVKARERISSVGDMEALDYVNRLLNLEEIQDEHLVGVESMAPFDEDELVFWQTRLGLIWHQNENCVDLYFPSKHCERATWLEHEAINDDVGHTNRRSLPIWDGYRMVGDKSRDVVVRNFESATARKPMPFPESACTVDPANWCLNWDAAISICPDIARWRPLPKTD